MNPNGKLIILSVKLNMEGTALAPKRWKSLIWKTQNKQQNHVEVCLIGNMQLKIVSYNKVVFNSNYIL